VGNVASDKFLKDTDKKPAKVIDSSKK
jgi:hypothetical protein